MDRSRNHTSQRTYPRSARVNALLQQILAEELERLADRDERLDLCTITGVSCDPDLRHAVVFMSSLGEMAAEALEEYRKALQSTIGAQVRMKRVPALKFMVDPAVEAGARVEEALRRARRIDNDEQGN